MEYGIMMADKEFPSNNNDDSEPNDPDSNV
jgi:hypothetical protein